MRELNTLGVLEFELETKIFGLRQEVGQVGHKSDGFTCYLPTRRLFTFSIFIEVLQLQFGCLPAAVCRGLPTIVKYLLEKTAVSIDKLYIARVSVFRNPYKYVEGTFTALEFAEKLNEADMKYGATHEELSRFLKCIKLLKKDYAF